MDAGDLLAERFRLRSEIGRGATGVVWEAWDEAGERLVAVKLLHERLTADGDALRTLEAEAAAAGRLRHDGIVGVHGLWAHGGRRLLVTERVTGESLMAWDGALSLDHALVVGEQVARALAHAHRTGRVHGDVRPGNVLLGPTGARLFDFGLASWVAAIGGLEGPVPTVRAGETAPEVIDGGPPVAASDLYGLGVVLVRALTGELPWAGPTPFAVIGAQRRTPPPLRGLPRGVRLLCRALLDPEPDRRPADAATVVRMLERLRRHPGRPPGFGGRWFAPIRPLGPWVVHGRDPHTGGPAVIRAGLSRRGARALVRRLTDEGWQVEASKEALDLVDLGWAGFGGFVAAWLIPLVGWIVAIPLILRFRSAPVRDRIRETLPVVRAPLPARRLPPGNEVAVAAGLLLMAMLPSSLLFPPLLLPIVACLAWLAWTSWKPPGDPVAERARTGRIETALAEAVALIEARELDLDTNLGLYGEWARLDHAWRRGGADSDRILADAEDLVRRARSAGRRTLSGPSSGS